jgi:carboxypeptidase Q
VFTRLQNRGQAPTVTLVMEAQNFPDKLSYNLVADLPGNEIPDEIVFMSGHMDSWDFGSGAMDDGQGEYSCTLASFETQTFVTPRL